MQRRLRKVQQRPIEVGIKLKRKLQTFKLPDQMEALRTANISRLSLRFNGEKLCENYRVVIQKKFKKLKVFIRI
jgi:hypothetical protein